MATSFQEVSTSDDANALENIQDRIADILEQEHYSEKDKFDVRLAVEEAFTNARKYGNQLDPAKKITLRFQERNGTARIEIEDEERPPLEQDRLSAAVTTEHVIHARFD
jgi:anti-sigma regulatory factor (Ser/Thr protein kinase)